MGNVVDEIRRSIRRLIKHQGFQSWMAEERSEAGDYILINNSFVFRDVETIKSDLYLCLEVGDSGKVKPDPKIATGIRLNSDFKRYSVRSQNLPRLSELKKAVSNQIQSIGQLLFLLIGKVQDRVVLTEAINHEAIESLSWDPSLGNEVQVSENHVTVGEIHDEESIWEVIEKNLHIKPKNVPSGLREAMGVAIDKLQDRAVAEVEIPPLGAQAGDGVTDAIVQVLYEQRNHYETALSRYVGDQDPVALNEILRIAYNFASDATQYVRLVVSICDLKPIVLWGTIAEHYALSEEFRRLPWTRSRNKPSLRNYEATISDARNSAFHNLFPFKKTLLVSLPDAALRGAELRIFSEHARKKENELTYYDKELVDILTKFTRARERRPSDRFWRQNLQLMVATIALFARTK